jgi:hypothetical protein
VLEAEVLGRRGLLGKLCYLLAAYSRESDASSTLIDFIAFTIHSAQKEG